MIYPPLPALNSDHKNYRPEKHVTFFPRGQRIIFQAKEPFFKPARPYPYIHPGASTPKPFEVYVGEHWLRCLTLKERSLTPSFLDYSLLETNILRSVQINLPLVPEPKNGSAYTWEKSNPGYKTKKISSVKCQVWMNKQTEKTSREKEKAKFSKLCLMSPKT